MLTVETSSVMKPFPSFGSTVIRPEPGSLDLVDVGNGGRFRSCKSSASVTETFRKTGIQKTPMKGFSRKATAAQKNSVLVRPEIVEWTVRHGLNAKSVDPHITDHSCSDPVRPLVVDRPVCHGQGRGCDVQADRFTAHSTGKRGSGSTPWDLFARRLG